jgi:dienelactone hydrolase
VTLERCDAGWIALATALMVVGCAPGQPDPSSTTPPSRFGSTLHAQPAHCGVPPYRWSDDAALGQVLERQDVRVYDLDLLSTYLEVLAEQGYAHIHRQPRARTFLERFRYLTQDQGRLVEATALLAYPDPREIAGPLPMVLHLHGTTGYQDACAPSRLADSPVAIDAALAAAFASYGFYVVAPDYLGMKSMGDPSTTIHPYLVGEATALASLDAARAGKALAALDGVTLGPLLVVGASQGGHATAMTVRYQPHYASDLPIAGAVYGIPPTDFLAHSARAVSQQTNPTVLGNVVATFKAQAAWYGVTQQVLEAAVAPAVLAQVGDAMAQSCVVPQLDLPLASVFSPDIIAAAGQPALGGYAPWDCIFMRNSPMDTTVERLDDAPVLMVLGSQDELVNATVERAAWEKMCQRGMRVELLECEGADHAKGFLGAVDQILDFLDARVAGVPFTQACQPSAPQRCRSDARTP